MTNLLDYLDEHGATYDRPLVGGSDLLTAGEKFASSEYVHHAREEVAAGTRDTGFKDFLVRASDANKHRWDASHPLIQFALSEALLELAESVLRVPVVLQNADIWLSMPWEGRTRQWSQGWHRDPEGARILKMFLYLRDVPSEAGPFEYVMGSHRSLFDLCPRGQYLAAEMEPRLPREQCKAFSGTQGTLVIANTTGLHRGGYGRQERLCATWTYTSRDYKAKKLIVDGVPERATRRQLQALGVR